MPKASDTQEAAPRAGFKSDGSPYPGVDPDTGERKAVTFEGLKSEFGPKRGEEIYFKISEIGGHGVNPSAPIDFRPDLALKMPAEKRTEVDKLFVKE